VNTEVISKKYWFIGKNLRARTLLLENNTRFAKEKDKYNDQKQHHMN